MASPEMSRRAFGCAALFGITGPLLVACGSDDSDGEGATSSPSESSTSGGGGGGGSGQGLIAAADVPVGGGVVLADQGIVVVQPEQGQFKGYTSVCTHQGNPVGEVSDGVITCNFHGSQFAVADGAVENGPATSPLPEIAVKVKGGQVVRA